MFSVSLLHNVLLIFCIYKFEASWYSKLKKTPDDDQQVNEQHRDINMTDFEDMFLWIGLKKHDFAFNLWLSLNCFDNCNFLK